MDLTDPYAQISMFPYFYNSTFIVDDPHHNKIILYNKLINITYPTPFISLFLAKRICSKAT